MKKLLKLIGKYKIFLAFSVIFAAISVVLQLYVPVLFGDAIDEVVSAHQVNFDMMWYYLKQILIFIVISAFATWFMNLLNNRMTYRIVQDIRSQAIRHIQVLPLSYLDQHSTGDIVSRVIADTDILSDGLLLGFTQLFSGIVTIVVTLIFMFSKNVWVTLLVIVLTPFSFVVAKFISSRSYTMFRKQSETRGRQTALIEEMIGGQKVVKAFGYEKESSRRFDEINKELQNYSQKAVFYSSLTNPSTRFVNNIFDLLEQKEETLDAEGAFATVDGNVTIDDVAFSYDKEKELIENFNLDVKPGMRIAIVGPTGCGKTTFINLLMRFYDVDEGKILVDGKDIREVSRHALRSSFGMVLQDTWIKSGTVRDNICFGKPDATDEEIIRAAKEARSWEFIRRLPKGLDTVLHEDSISQGQKQLLCITRVMLCLPPMLILDEATSSIDTRTELQVQEAFDKLMKGRTSFIVAHRLSTIRNASLILVMKDGKIIEQGNHEELLKKGGFYHKLYHSQFEG